MDDRQELPIESALRHKTTRRSAEDNGAGKTEDHGAATLHFILPSHRALRANPMQTIWAQTHCFP
jgi:hypothetical protein